LYSVALPTGQAGSAKEGGVTKLFNENAHFEKPRIISKTPENINFWPKNHRFHQKATENQ